MYTSDTTFQIADVKVHHEDGETYIGPDVTGNYLILSPGAFQILELFGQGKTFEEVCLKYGLDGERHELDGALQILAQKGIISTTPIAPPSVGAKTLSDSLWISRLAGTLFSTQFLVGYLLLALVAIIICFYDPGAAPTRSALIFQHNRSLCLLGIASFSVVTVSIHELGHMLAARNVGVRSKFSLGHRLWILVAETDLSGLWAIPRRKRYVPLLAGMIVDCVSVSLLICAVEGARLHNGHHADLLQHLLLAGVFTYISRLIWQFFLFLRTDLYYVFSTSMRCTNLMQYTQAYIRQVFRRIKIPLLEDISDRERRIVQYYAWFWLFGQIAALAFFLMISVPVSVRYVSAGFRVLRDHYQESYWALADSAAVILMVLIPWIIGCAMWGKGLLQRRSWGS